MSENNQLLLLILFEWSHVKMHCFKMLLFLFSAIEITTLRTHITCQDWDSPPHFKCRTGKGFFNVCQNDDKRSVSKIYVKNVFDFKKYNLQFLSTIFSKGYEFDNSQPR